jgi:hypothetical protein
MSTIQRENVSVPKRQQPHQQIKQQQTTATTPRACGRRHRRNKNTMAFSFGAATVAPAPSSTTTGGFGFGSAAAPTPGGGPSSLFGGSFGAPGRLDRGRREDDPSRRSSRRVVDVIHSPLAFSRSFIPFDVRSLRNDPRTTPPSPAPASTTSGGIFGAPAPAPSGGTGLFGSSSAAPAPSSSSSFGAVGLFGSSSTPAPASSTGGLFGAPGERRLSRYPYSLIWFKTMY